MSIMIVDLESSRKNESNEYDTIDKRAHSIFNNVYFRWLTCGGVLLVIPSIFGEFG
jgi:hypothetical protein